MKRIAVMLVMFVGAGLALAGCASGPSQVDAAAIVGNNTISVDSVQQELTTVLNSQQTAQAYQQQNQLDEISRNIVTAKVRHQLVLDAVQQNKITIDENQVDQLIASVGGTDAVAKNLVTDPALVRDLAYDELAEQQLARLYAGRVSATVSFVSTNSRDDAIAAANKLAADPSSAPALVAAATQAGGSGQVDATVTPVGYMWQVQTEAAQEATAPDVTPLLGANANTVVVFSPTSGQGGVWVAALITKRTVSATPVTGTSSVVANATPDTLAEVGAELLQQNANKLGVRISPRYGSWDPVSMQVIDPTDAATQKLAGEEIPVHSSAS
ncbi:MAG TPA: SurA N-terminal domain-containing protein [Pseudonocardiaceae bacterium]